METSDLSVAKRNETSRVSWINHGLFKAFMAGLVISSGFSLTNTFENFLKEPVTMTAGFVADVVVPIVCIYLVGDLVKKFLSRYGFEGYSNIHGQSITIAQIVSEMTGLVIGGTITELFFFILKRIYTYVGDDRFLSLLVMITLGIAVIITLRRRLSQIRKA